MGCVLSSANGDERIGKCKERKKIIKQLVGIREEFSDSLLAYLKALRNAGATLRQFTESDTLEFDIASNGAADPPSPPPHLLPPPLPPFLAEETALQISQGEILESDNHYDVPTQETDPGMNSHWLFQHADQVETVEEENWEETKTEFEDEDPDSEAGLSVGKSRSVKQPSIGPVDDNSSAMTLYRKDTETMSMVAGRKGKALEGIVKELDDYFLKASACIKEIAVLIDISGADTLLRQNSRRYNRKRDNSAKVFSVLSRSWYSKSTQFTKDATEFSSPNEPCKPGAHCSTLKKLYAAEKDLFKAIKEEGIAKLEFEKMSLLLERQENENLDLVKIDKTRSRVQNLESDVVNLQQSISETTSLILEVIDEELLPQLVALTAGLSQMWRTMHECHRAQALISQQLSNLSDNHNTILNSEYHHQATIQFETETSYWYNSFCKLVKSQRDYVSTLHKWIERTSCLRDGHQRSDHSSIDSICRQWELGLDGLPDKETSEAIKSLLLSIRSIISQQAEEDNILKRLGKLERKLQRCLSSLAEMEAKNEGSYEDDGEADKNPKLPLYAKKTESEALKKQVESVKEDYLDSVQCSRAMTLNHLKTGLPNLFQSLMEFSSASAQAIESINAQSSQ